MDHRALIVAVGMTFFAGCATNTDTNKTAAADDDKEYITGSRIPVKTKVPSGVKATSDRNTIDELMRKGSGSGGGMTGAGGS